MLSKDDIIRRKQMREAVLNTVHGFFRSRGFEHFETPLIVKSPGMEPNLDPIEVDLKLQSPSRSVKAGLITSPEFSLKKLLGAGFEKIYSVTPVFRNNEGGSHNIPEFTMLEWYAPGDYNDLMLETEDLLKAVLDDQSSWPRIRHVDVSVDSAGDPHVSESRFFITHFPVDQAALARIVDQNVGTAFRPSGAGDLKVAPSLGGSYAERFEAYADGLELCNGFCELTDSAEQRRRFEKEAEERRALGKTVFPVDTELLEALSKIKGSVYGNALGVDRLVMLKYGISDINDIQIFPYA